MASARRSRFDTSSSTPEIATRALTPEVWSTRSLSRAATLISSISRRARSGITTAPSPPRSVHASWAVICWAVAASGG